MSKIWTKSSPIKMTCATWATLRVCMLQGLPFVFSFPPPVFVPFCPFIFVSLSLPFVPIGVSVCILCFAFSLFAVCFCFFSLRLIFFCFLVFCSLVLFCFPGVLRGGGHVLVFCILVLSRFYTPRDACEPEICKTMRMLLCVSFLCFWVFIASLPDLIFPLSLPPWMCVLFFDF